MASLLMEAFCALSTRLAQSGCSVNVCWLNGPLGHKQSTTRDDQPRDRPLAGHQCPGCPVTTCSPTGAHSAALCSREMLGQSSPQKLQSVGPSVTMNPIYCAHDIFISWAGAPPPPGWFMTRRHEQTMCEFPGASLLGLR